MGAQAPYNVARMPLFIILHVCRGACFVRTFTTLEVLLVAMGNVKWALPVRMHKISNI